VRASSLVSVVKANVKRAVVISGVVGTALLLINHGDHLASEPVCDHFYWKAGGMYAVPFAVSLVSAVLASRR